MYCNASIILWVIIIKYTMRPVGVAYSDFAQFSIAIRFRTKVSSLN